jgi:hypothetical protein
VAQSGSAPGWGPGGRRFKSCLPDHLEEGRTAPVSEKEAGGLVSVDRADKVRRLIEALTGIC